MLENLFYSKVGQSLLSAVGVKPPLDLNRYDSSNTWVKATVALAVEPSTELKAVLEAAQIKCKP